MLHWSQTREYFLFTGKYIFNEFSLLSVECRCRYKSHMLCLFVSAGSTYVGVSEGSFVHNRFSSWTVGSAILHEHSRMPFANRIDPMSTSLSHTTVLYVHIISLFEYFVFASIFWDQLGLIYPLNVSFLVTNIIAVC